MAVVVVGVLAACDPGGSYHAPGGIVVMDDGRRYILGGASQTQLRVHASWFTSSVHASVGITNNGSTPLEIRPNELHMADRQGPLQPWERAVTCRHHEGALVTLAPGETCEMRTTFSVTADRDRLDKLTMTHDGVTRGGVAVPVSVILVMD